MRPVEEIKKIIIKVGSSSLCNEKGILDKEKILHIILQISQLVHDGYCITLVSSGAIASGMGALSLEKKPDSIPDKQALAAIGQAKLMQIYEEIFDLFGLKCAQILLNHDDFDDPKRLENLHHTMNSLINYGVIPIVNENDALAVEEIKVGDNDTLSALLAKVMNADLLVLVSDIDGLYTKNPHLYKDAQLIRYVEDITPDIMSMAGGSSQSLGTGGMLTKLNAAKIVNDQGCHMVIVNGRFHHCIVNIFNEYENGTWFQAK